jgi:hypothetical protein
LIVDERYRCGRLYVVDKTGIGWYSLIGGWQGGHKYNAERTFLIEMRFQEDDIGKK